MLNTLLKLKEHCQEIEKENKKVRLSAVTWEKIEEIVKCLKPSYETMKKLQKEDITLPDIYKIINLCHFQTHDIGNIRMHFFHCFIMYTYSRCIFKLMDFPPNRVSVFTRFGR